MAVGDRLRVVGVREQGGAAGRLRHRAAVRCDDRAPARHRLEDGQAERLVVRGVHEHVGGAVERAASRERDPADPHDVGRRCPARRPGRAAPPTYSRPRRCPTTTSRWSRQVGVERWRTHAAARRSSCRPTARRRRGRTGRRCRARAARRADASSGSPGRKTSWSTASGMRRSLAGSTSRYVSTSRRRLSELMMMASATFAVCGYPVRR